MKKLLATLLVGVFVVVMAGFSGGAKDAAPADPAVEAPGGTAAADPAAAGATGLAGTKWQLGEYVVDFKDDGKVLVKGGQIATLMPDGAEGEYKVEDGKFSVSVLGQSFNGTWDGSKLVVDGNEAVPQ